MFELASQVAVPILNDLAPEGFAFGRAYLVEFEPHSLWYETSSTIAAAAVGRGIKTEYHTFMHSPDEVRNDLTRLGLDVKKSEEVGLLRILDTYSSSLKLDAAGKPVGTPAALQLESFPYQTISFNLQEWGNTIEQEVAAGFPDGEKRWLHIDDNTSVFTQASEEREVVNAWRTRFLPWARARELVMFNSVVSGVASEAFYKQCESLYDGILDFISKENEAEIGNYVRVRFIRGKSYSTKWRRLGLQNNGEVRLTSEVRGSTELGIRSWLKGSK